MSLNLMRKKAEDEAKIAMALVATVENENEYVNQLTSNTQEGG